MNDLGETSPGQIVCDRCRKPYDSADPDKVRYHTEPIDDCHCGRCRGKPQCYNCGSSFCMCPSH